MANQNKNTKIALIGYLLAKGGMERALSTASQLLHNAECDVHLIVLEDEVEYPYFGTLLNLGKYSKYQKYFKLRNYLETHQFDYVIDFRNRNNPFMELVFLHYIYSGFKTIYTVHTSVLPIHFTNNRWVAHQMFNKIYKIVAVSSKMNEKINKEYQFDQGVVISNCIAKKIDLPCLENVLPFKYIIAIGRMVKMKQLDKLIETYSSSDLPDQEIHLVILGEGEEQAHLEQLIENLDREDFIHLLGFKADPTCYTKNADFLVLTSQYEGFPMVILETLHTGIPVVSFDCETGPSEMIVNEYNGLLVENQNFNALKDALNRFANDVQLLAFCKTNAKSSVDQFSADVIQEKWLDLLHLNKLVK